MPQSLETRVQGSRFHISREGLPPYEPPKHEEFYYVKPTVYAIAAATALYVGGCIWGLLMCIEERQWLKLEDKVDQTLNKYLPK